jgi:hypothetical protein
MAMPCGSTTTPEILPVSAWARTGDAVAEKKRAEKRTASPHGSPPFFVSFVVEKSFVPFVFRTRT